jgi:hypothetical protein
MMNSSFLTAIMTVATISVSSSLAVITTWLFFPQMRYKLFMQIIAFIAIGDLIGNIPYVMPYRGTAGGWWCTLSGLMNFTGYPIEWMWTTTLIYFLYSLSVKGYVPYRLWLYHLLCWGVPVVLALCSLSFGNLRAPDNIYEVCVIPIEVAPVAYHVVTYYGLFYVCLITMVVLLVRLRVHMIHNPPDTPAKQRAFKVTIDAARWYSWILFVFWLPHNVTSVSTRGYSSHTYDILLMWKVLHGTATAVVFFVQSREARKLWRHYFRAKFCDPSLPYVVKGAPKEDLRTVSEDLYRVGNDLDADDLFGRTDSVASTTSNTSTRTPSFFREGSEIVMPPLHRNSHNSVT